MQIVYLDESYDKTSPYFVMSGYGATAAQWDAFSKEWLHATQSIHYVKMSDAGGWSIDRRKHYFPYLHNVIVNHVNFAVEVIVDREALSEIYGDVSPINANAYYFCFFRILEKVGSRFGPPVGSGDLQFVFDKELSTLSHLGREWSGFMERCPPNIRNRIKNSPKFQIDDDCPPLQAADFRAWWARADFNMRLAGKSFDMELKPKKDLTVLSSRWDRAKLLEGKAYGYNPAFPSGVPDVPGADLRLSFPLFPSSANWPIDQG